MASTNQSPEYQQAEKHFLQAQTDEERLVCLEEMIRQAPKHKSGESMRANLKTRYIKLKEKLERIKRTKKSAGKAGIKKEGLQAVLIGLTSSGKSSILSVLTNAKPAISPVQFTTKQPMLGTLNYSEVKIQIVDMPAVESEYFDTGIAHTADVLITVITSISDLEKILSLLHSNSEKLIVYNKIDLLNEYERRKLEAQLKSRKIDALFFSAKTSENIQELKENLFLKFHKIRIYTKQPKHPADLDPVIMSPNSTVKDIAEKIFHGFSQKVREARVSGPSSKFPNQIVGLSHVLRDKDIVEFRTD